MVESIAKKIITELCLAGAANRGICYIGVLKCLTDNNMLSVSTLEKFVGVSIGSLVGVCYIIGFELNELFEFILETDLNELQDISFDSVLHNGSILQGNSYRIGGSHEYCGL